MANYIINNNLTLTDAVQLPKTPTTQDLIQGFIKDLEQFQQILYYIDDADPKFIEGYNSAVHAVKEVGLPQLISKYQRLLEEV